MVRPLDPIDFIATQPHWIDHLAPVWLALAPHERGEFMTDARWLGHAAARGVDATHRPARPKRDWTLTVVCSETDRRRAGRWAVRFEHGVGFSFHGSKPHPSYAGAPGNTNVYGFFSPNAYAHRLWEAEYPDARTAIVGTPKLDRWHRAPAKPMGDPPTVCVGFHWDCRICPETRWALPHFASAVEALANVPDLEVIGTGHHKAGRALPDFFRGIGVEWVRDFEEVMRRADVYANDSSSTLYEFASLDRPVVVMNAPWFRRDVHHGLRFWEHADVGPNANEPEDLLPAVMESANNGRHWWRERLATANALYPYRGRAAAIAAGEVRNVRDSGRPKVMPGRRARTRIVL